MKSITLAFGSAALLAAAPGGAAPVDTTQWVCASCPFDKGTSGTVEVGAGVVSDASAAYGDTTGLQRKGGFAVLGVSARWRGDGGLYGSVSASDLGLDVRAVAAELGREGSGALRLAYDELPRHLSDSATTPFSGSGGANLTLPAGFPAATTAAMPLATTLQRAELGAKRTRFSLGATLVGSDTLSYRAELRHDVRDGTARSAGSFFANAAQLVAPVDQTTDQLSVSAAYAAGAWQAALGYHASLFRNADTALSWSSPFTAGVLGAGRGQLALPPDNQLHQLQATLGYDIAPGVRASADVAVGRMTQDDAFLPATLNAALAVPALPAQSLGGSVATLDATVRVSAALGERWRLNASASRNDRDNRTTSRAYAAVSTDLFVGAQPRSNQPYGFTQDRLKIAADYRGTAGLKAALGAELDTRRRTLQDTGVTRDTLLWGRVVAAPVDKLVLTLKLAHAERRPSGHAVNAAVDPPENPLLRRFNMARRVRDSVALRADIAASDTLTLGIDAGAAVDDYDRSALGLVAARSGNVGVDAAWAASDRTQLHAFAHIEQLRSRQVGSQLQLQPDWSGRTRDTAAAGGVGITHAVIKDKLDIGAELAVSRTRSQVAVDTGALDPAFPRIGTAHDSLKLNANYRMQKNLSLLGSFWHARYAAQDWHLNGVQPATVPNLLAFGEQPPGYRVNVLRVALRYGF